MNKSLPLRSSNIERDLITFYTANPSKAFVNRLEDELLALRSIGPNVSARRSWMGKSQHGYGWARIAGACALFLALITLLLTTPQGRAWAQAVIHFFTPASSTTFPLTTQEVEMALPPQQTTAPTFSIQLVPLAPDVYMDPIYRTLMITPLALPGCGGAEAAQSYACQVANAEAMAGFKAKQLPGDTIDWYFRAATGFKVQPYTGVDLIYQAVSFLGTSADLTVRQGIGDFPSDDKWEAVPADVIKQVQVGTFPAEYVQGDYFPSSYYKIAAWSNDNINQRLRWREGERWFEISEWGGYWLKVDAESLVAMAESLTYAPGTYQRRLNPNYLTTIKDAETVAGFNLLEPGLLPDQFTFTGARFESGSKRIRMEYQFRMVQYITYSAGIVIIETPLKAAAPNQMPEAYLSDTVEKVRIGSSTGVYMNLPSRDPWTMMDSFTVWKPDVPQLVWKQKGLIIDLYYFPIPEYGGRLTKADLLAIARSFK